MKKLIAQLNRLDHRRAKNRPEKIWTVFCLTSLVVASSLSVAVSGQAQKGGETAIRGKVEKSSQQDSLRPSVQANKKLWPANDISSIQVSPDGHTLYIVLTGTDCIAVFDTESLQQIGSVPVHQPWHMRLSPDGTKIYADTAGEGAADGSNFVLVIDAATGKVTDRIFIGNAIVGSDPRCHSRYT